MKTIFAQNSKKARSWNEKNSSIEIVQACMLFLNLYIPFSLKFQKIQFLIGFGCFVIGLMDKIKQYTLVLVCQHHP